MNATWNRTRDCLLESQETERQRLAQELHDGPLQELHSLDFGLVTLARYLESEAALDHWNAMRTMLQSVSRQLRTLCQDLRPPALGPFGLSAVLYSYAENFQLLHPDVRVDLELDDDNQQLPEPVRVTLYRICQQALRNVAQHANAENVRIILHLNDNWVTLTVEDDGAGFNTPTTWLEWAHEGRFGLFEAFQRAAAIGGELEIDSQPAQGVRLRVTAPLTLEINRSPVPATNS